jgi:hypothetical protein
MQIGSLKRQHGIWQFKLTLSVHSPWRLEFQPFFELAFLKILQFPVGEPLLRSYYRGIYWQFALPLPRASRYYAFRPLHTFIGIIPGGQILNRFAATSIRFSFMRRLLRKQFIVPVAFTLA